MRLTRKENNLMLDLNNTFEEFLNALVGVLNDVLQTLFTNLTDVLNSLRVF